MAVVCKGIWSRGRGSGAEWAARGGLIQTRGGRQRGFRIRHPAPRPTPTLAGLASRPRALRLAPLGGPRSPPPGAPSAGRTATLVDRSRGSRRAGEGCAPAPASPAGRPEPPPLPSTREGRVAVGVGTNEPARGWTKRPPAPPPLERPLRFLTQSANNSSQSPQTLFGLPPVGAVPASHPPISPHSQPSQPPASNLRDRRDSGRETGAITGNL